MRTFSRSLGQLQTAEARWLRALRPYGLSIHTWESMELTRSTGSSFWYVQLHADILRAQLHFTQVSVSPASFAHAERTSHPQRPFPVHTKATQTAAGPGGFPHEAAVWHTPQQPTHCEPGLFPEVSSILADAWCDTWHIKCLIPCIPGYQAWVLRDGSRLVGLCTVDITWDLVSQALHISPWELPQTFVHGDGLLIPYPEPLLRARDKCLSVSHDTPEAVACLHRLSNPTSDRSYAAGSSGRVLPLVWLLCSGLRRIMPCLGARLAIPIACSVRLDETMADAAADLAPEPLPFRDYMDLTRTCTMSWTHELSRQTLGFSVRAQILGEHLQRISPAPEILVNVWKPGRGPILLQVRPRRLALHLSGFLRVVGYSEGIDSLHVAFDTNPHALDLVLVPPTGGTWWILQDSTGLEVLRPVVRHYSSPVHFRLLTVSPDRVAQTVCPAYSVVRQPLLPQGARGRVIRDLPELSGSLCQGILSFAAAASFRRGPSLAFGLLGLLLHHSVVHAVVDPVVSSTASAGTIALPSHQPQILRIWTVGVKRPVDLPWKPEGYDTRWLHAFVSGLHGVRGAGQFLSTTGAAGDSVMHLLFVPRLHNPGGGQPRFWLFHVEDRASVVYGHHPFDWNIAATHLGEIYQGLNVPSSRPTLVIGSQLVSPGCHLTNVPSGSIVQIPIGALPMESSNDAWDPTPWVVPGPFFQYVPARGPAGEEAVSPNLNATSELRLDAPATHDVACQTEQTPTVDAPLLSAPVVRDLALQLQGMAECLLALPFDEPGTRPSPSSHSPTSLPLAPVFCGPPLASVASESVDTYSSCAQGQAAIPEVGPDSSRSRSAMPLLGLILVLFEGGPRVPFWAGFLWLALSVDGAWGSYFTPNASESEEEAAPPTDPPDNHRPGDGLHSRPAGPPPPTPAGSVDQPDPADARLVYNDTVPPDLNYLPGSMRSVHDSTLSCADDYPLGSKPVDPTPAWLAACHCLPEWPHPSRHPLSLP